MLTVEEKLDRLRNRATTYEVALVHEDGRRYLVGYSPSVIK